MARGKHAVSAARRRVEAKDEHIDSLTEKLAEVKMKARQYERDALRLTSVLAEVERLRAQTDRTTSDLVEQLKAEREQLLVEFSDRLDALAEIIRRHADQAKFPAADLVELERLLGHHRMTSDMESHRSARRASTTRRGISAEALIRELSDEQLRDLGLRRFGHLLRRIEASA